MTTIAAAHLVSRVFADVAAAHGCGMAGGSQGSVVVQARVRETLQPSTIPSLRGASHPIACTSRMNGSSMPRPAGLAK